MQSDRTPTLLSIKEFLREVPIGRTLLYDQIRRGQIRSVKIGARTMIPSTELQRLVASSGTRAADRGDPGA